MDFNSRTAYLLLVVVFCVGFAETANFTNSTNTSHQSHTSKGEGIVIFKFDIHHVATPFVVCCWVLLASISKILFHHSEWISSTIPESCMLILLGLPIGFILNALNVTDDEQIFLSSELFFNYLLPPIILDAGYFMPSQVFYSNIGTILLYAVFGTMFNAFAVGVSLWATADVSQIDLPILNALLFGSLISAVDPVAVLAVFEEVHVHEVLYMLVFGESVLNDAASVVLYRTFESLVESTVDAKQVGLAIASFFVVSIGGTLVGIVFALTTSFITKYTEHVRVIEPALVFLMAYMSYLSAEIFHFSGIMSILFCGIVMKPYVESNVSRKSHTTIKYFLKLLSSACESLIFMFLGVSLVHSKHNFNFSFVCLTLLFTTIYRAIGVVFLTGVANRFGRLTKVKRVEQFIMSYGGLRGAVAFCLAILIKSSGVSDFRNIVVTTTISVVIFTVFIQGTTIKKLVEVLGVRRSQKREKSMAETLNDRMLGYMVAGVEDIIGVHRNGYFINLLAFLNRKYLRQWLERDPELFLDEDLVYAERRMAFKHALCYATNPSMILARENDEAELNDLKKNPSIAMQLALKAQEAKGPECGIIDINILKADGENILEENSEAFNQRSITGLIPKARKLSKRTYSKRKYTLDSLDEKEAVEDRYLKLKRDEIKRRQATSHSNKHHHHRRHHHRHKHAKKSSQKPDMDTLPEMTEMENPTVDIKAKYEINGSDSNSDDEDGGIHFNVSHKAENKSFEDEYGPSLPASCDAPISSTQYANIPILDNAPKKLTGRDQEGLQQAQRWRSFSLDSAEDVQASDDVRVDISEP